MLRANSLGIEGPLQVSCPSPAALVVRSPEDWPQLASFRPPDGEYLTSMVDYTDYMNLRSVLRFFKQQAGSYPSIFADKLDQGIVKNNPARRRILQGLLDLNIIERVQDHYYLNTGKLSETGVDLPSLNSGEPNQAVLKLISDLNGQR